MYTERKSIQYLASEKFVEDLRTNKESNESYWNNIRCYTQDYVTRLVHYSIKEPEFKDLDGIVAMVTDKMLDYLCRECNCEFVDEMK